MEESPFPMPSDTPASQIPGRNQHCVLMFSGGRDSTLAALRLHQQGYNLTLVTICSDHLQGIDSVRARLREIRRILPGHTQWLRIRQPKELRTDTSFYETTCLPCHHAYVVVAVAVAVSLAVTTLAFGYAGYQNTWPEQTPTAISHLRATLGRHGIDLLLPVYDLASRQEAQTELGRQHLSIDALEQKCSQQIDNVALSPDRLQSQIALWERAIGESLSKLTLLELNTLETSTLASV